MKAYTIDESSKPGHLHYVQVYMSSGGGTIILSRVDIDRLTEDESLEISTTSLSFDELEQVYQAAKAEKAGKHHKADM